MSRKTRIRAMGSGENFESTRKLLKKHGSDFTRLTTFKDGTDEDAEERFIIEANVRTKNVGRVLEKLIKTTDDVIVGD